MKIFRNIPGAVKVYSNLRYLNGFKREIDDARAKGDQEREMENICYAISTWGDKLSKSLGMDIKVYGKENLPEKGPVVFMSNHQGYADILALCAAIDTVQFGFVAKKELAKIPLYGKWMDRIRSVMMDRDNPKESLKAITKGIGLLKKGYSLVIFPEGTRSKGGPSTALGEQPLEVGSNLRLVELLGPQGQREGQRGGPGQPKVLGIIRERGPVLFEGSHEDRGAAPEPIDREVCHLSP